MKVRRWIPFVSLTVLSLILAAAAVDAQGPTLIAGPNVNMVSGTTWPDGDPFLQRQNEPSVAVSTRNPLHLMAASNDYRTVDLPGLPEGLPIADSWIGVYTSLDGGGSWTSTLLPGYPQDETVAGQASPIYGLQAAADPVKRAGTHGMFYLSGIVFDRGATPRSKLFVARYVDLNNDPKNPIQYIDTVEITSYDFPSNVFIDKPWLAVDVPGSSPTTTTFSVTQEGNPASPVSQTVQCGNLYLAWAEIESIGDTVVESRIMSSTSTNCGDTWSTPQEISTPGTINQGATVAVSPNPGNVYVAWRQLTGLGVTGDCGRGPGYWTNNLDWPLDALPMTLGGVSYMTQESVLEILGSPGTAKGDARLILGRQLAAAKLSNLDVVDPAVAATMALADVWLTENPIGVGPKPKKDVKTEGTDLAVELTYYNLGVLGPVVCGTAPPGTSDDAIMVTASTNGGTSFDSPPTVVRSLETYEAFDQGTTEWSFRTTAYPTMTSDAAGRIYIAWAERGEALLTGDPDPVEGDSRIMVATLSYSSGVFTEFSLNPIDRPEIPGHQIQPTITCINDHLFLVYNDFRKDYSGVFDRFVMDLMTPIQPYRHTVDVRAAVAYPGVSPVFTDYSLSTPEPSTQASRYLFIPTIQGISEVLVFEQLEFNPPNLEMFKAGTVPFFGDYVDIAGASPFIPDGSGGWTYNTNSAVQPVAHAVWTDNRDVVGPPPPDFDWTSFVPAGSSHTSIFDGATPVPACVPGTDDADRTGMRNQNIYTSRLTTGLFVAVPGNSRPLGVIPGTTDLLQRAFVIFTQNGTAEERFFRLEIPAQPAGGQASFAQFSSAPLEDVAIEAYSSFSRTVFVTSSDADASIEVVVTEFDAIGGSAVSNGLQSSVLINPDPTNPDPADTSLLTGEVYNPAVFNPAVYNPAVYNPAVLNSTVFNPAVFNPAVLNWNVFNPAVYNPAVLNPAVFNQAVFSPAVFNQAMMALALMNPAVYNPAVLNPAVFNPAVLNPAVFNPAVFNPAVLNPAVLNPAVFNPAVFNPAVLNPAVLNPAVLNPAVYNTTFEENSFTDFNYVVENRGNASTAYSPNLSLENPPDGLLYQLMVYRIYFTPVANDCELTEAAQQEILINDNNPNLDADLLDPHGEDTFYLDPGDYAVVTLRVIPDPDHTTPVDPADVDDLIDDDLSVSVVACCVNTADADDGETQPPFAQSLADNLPPLDITTTTLPAGNEGVAYPAQTLAAVGGAPPYTWSMAPGSGPLPPGMSVSAAGVIDGTPTADGIFNFTVRATDFSQIDEQALSISVAPAGGPVFLVQPTAATAGESIPAFSVTVLNDTASPVAGITVTLAIGNNACPTGTLLPSPVSAVTNGLGIATFSSLTIDRGGHGYTLEATATILGTPFTTESDPFGLVGFCETSSMGSPRVGATSTRLFDGRILVVGGAVESRSSAADLPLASAEIFDSSIPGWTPLGTTLIQARALHTATLLDDGTVLIAGGTANSLPATGSALNSLEIFDPAGNSGAGSFSPLGITLATARMGHTATLLTDGRVLIAGGRSGAAVSPYLNSAEIFDPGTGTLSTPGNTMPTGRSEHTATLLNDGTVLLVGGFSVPLSPPLRSADIFDPSGSAGLGDFTATDDMTEIRINHTATLLDDGRVLVVGGTGPGGNTHNSAEIFDLSIGGGTFNLPITMSTSRERHAAEVLPNGHVLLAGGVTVATPVSILLDSVELFDPSAGTFAFTHSLDTARQYPMATKLGDGRILVSGGMDPALDGIAEAEIFWPIGGEALWTRQFGTSVFDYAHGISVHTTGVYVAGRTWGAFAGQTSAGDRDAFVRKYDFAGNEVWTRQFGSSAVDEISCISVDGTGVYVAGFTSGTLPGQASAGGDDAFVRKYDLAGNEVWTRQFGTAAPDGDFVFGISLDGSGIFVAGETGGALPGQTSAGGVDAFVRKYDFAGNEVWTSQFGTTEDEYARGISVDASDVYVAGGTLGTFPGQTPTGYDDGFVRKLDFTGSEIWTRQFSSTNRDYSHALSVDTSGVYVAGSTRGTLPGETTAGGIDAFVRKYDSAGNEVWTRQFGSASGDGARGISVDASGLYLTGYTLGALPNQISTGNYDVWVRKYNFAGGEIWTRQFGSTELDYSWAISVDTVGAYLYVAGSTFGTLQGQASSGQYDAFVVKLVR